MSIIISNKLFRFTSALTLSSVLLLTILLSVMPEYFTAGAKNAISICLTSVVPALFLFILLTKIIVSSGFSYLLSKPFGRIFNLLTGLPPFCAGIYLFSFLSGYPAGVIAAAEAYKNGNLTKSDAEHLIAISNNTGPALPVLLIGAELLGNKRAGAAIYLIQIISAFTVAFIFRVRNNKKYEPVYPKTHTDVMRAVTASVDGSMRALASLCAYVIAFSAVNDALSLLRLPFIDFIKPFVEIAGGACALSGNVSPYSFIALSAALSFGGLCVYMQAASVCARHSLSSKKLFIYKLTQALVAAILSAVYALFA